MSENFTSERLIELERHLPESLWIKINRHDLQFLICNIYRKPNATVDFWERLNISLEKALETSTKIILMGDINEDQLCASNHKFRDILIMNGFTNVITLPTRVTENTATLIDPIAISNTVDFLHSGIYQTPKDISDHFGTYAYFNYVYQSI